ncbi:MAG: hypothetical protein GY752_05280 [bacterium]|nr:hypothetical protein [bacterium]
MLRKTHVFLFSIIALALMCSSTFAQVENSIGIYYDIEGTNSCAPEMYHYPQTVYLIAKNVTCAYGISGWEGRLSWDEGIQFIPGSISEGFNLAQYPSYQVGIGEQSEPVNGDAILLATFVMIASAPGGVYFSAIEDPSINGAQGALFAHGDNAGVLTEFNYESGSHLDPLITMGVEGCNEPPQFVNPKITEVDSPDPQWPLISTYNSSGLKSGGGVNTVLKDSEICLSGRVVSLETPRFVQCKTGSRYINRISTRAVLDHLEVYWGPDVETITLELFDFGQVQGFDTNIITASCPDIGAELFLTAHPIGGSFIVVPSDVLFDSSRGFSGKHSNRNQIEQIADQIGLKYDIFNQLSKSDLVVVSELDHICEGGCHNGKRVHFVTEILKGSCNDEIVIDSVQDPDGYLFPHAKESKQYLYFLVQTDDGKFIFLYGMHSAFELKDNSILSYLGVYISDLELVREQ